MVIYLKKEAEEPNVWTYKTSWSSPEYIMIFIIVIIIMMTVVPIVVKNITIIVITIIFRERLSSWAVTTGDLNREIFDISIISIIGIIITLLTFEFWHRPQCNGLYFLASNFSFYYLFQPRDTNQSDKISAHRRLQSWKSEVTFYRNDLLFVVKSLRRLQGGDLYKWHQFNEILKHWVT